MEQSDDWYKKAVFYEVLVRSFADSSGNGSGDMRGLASKLDYLAWLGVDCLWLPPFFPSPLRDGGYDVADYMGVQPELGTLEDVGMLIKEAHDRGLRVITDFVMNHTSDAHPWFQESRSDPDGPYGDFYVWRDEPLEYLDARIIVLDTEESNWTWDPVREQYFWHRFYSHQPDLNFENPAVLEELMKAIRFWLDQGVDGFRLDAVPYLIEQDGTNCENLTGTHDILKQVRAMVDAEYPGRILLCEANQWPDDVIEYFGDSDECHMAFHFPVMPRLYMGLRRGSRESISQILADTPPIPEGTQWGTFLRNHDELTLEMVTEEERQYMWAEYAPVPRMKCNLGIRRRLAPLVEGDQRRIRLLHAMLLALPGSPVLYYGDEIGMGDNIWLNDRDGVRTPMQWNAEPGAGFSTADPAEFVHPLISDPVYSNTYVNVQAQASDPGSLLNWLHGMLHLRREHDLFGLGDFTDLGGSHQVFSFTRSFGDTTLVALNNLTGTNQVASVNLAGLAGRTPRVIAGIVEPREVTDEPYPVPLTPYAFCWLLFEGNRMTVTRPSPDALRTAWWQHLQTARWFGGKGTAGEVSALEPLAWYTPEGAWPAVRSEIATITYSSGVVEYYQFLAAYRPAGAASGLADVDVPGLGTVTASDATLDPEAIRALVDGVLASPHPALEWRHRVAIDADTPVKVFGGEQSNTTLVIGSTSLFKLFRKVEPGTNLDADVLAALDGADSTPRLEARLTADWPDGTSTDLGILIERVDQAEDGWEIATASCSAGTDFSDAAHALGAALREVHERLASAFGRGERSGDELADHMERRLRDAVAQAAELDQLAGDLSLSFGALRGRTLPVQRVHGDFHLGQTLRSPAGWTIIDFEGEPAKTASERREFDSVWRDVAGMMRSFDYARSAHRDPSGTEATQWAEDATQAFLTGYCETTQADSPLLSAYEVDKAVYEVLYELRNRPDWVSIPMRAVTDQAARGTRPLGDH